jgi:hypothetical protein
MVEQGGELSEKTAEEIQRDAEEEIARIERLARELDKRKGTTICMMTRGARRMRIGMDLLQGDTTQSSTHDIAPIVNDSGTGHDQSVNRLVWSSTRESKSTVRRPIMPWLQGCSLIRSPPFAKG